MDGSITVSGDGRNDIIEVAGETTIMVAHEEVIVPMEVGIQGPAGPQGASGDSHFEQSFTNQSSVTVTHNLGKYPAVEVIDSANDGVVGNVKHNSKNELTVTFASSFSGIVICN